MFEAFRPKGWYTYYGSRRTAATYDVTTIIVTYCAVVMATLVVMIVLGQRGRHKFTTFFRLVFNLSPSVIITVRDIREQYVEALQTGLPAPIIYVLEYLEADYGGLRWHRVIRQAGHFAYVMLGFALALWTLAYILLAFVVTRGAVFMAFVGAIMFGACALYHGLHPGDGLDIPFEERSMTLHYGWSFWLCLAGGIQTFIWGTAIVICRKLSSVRTDKFFLLDASHLETSDDDDDDDEQWRSQLVINTPLGLSKHDHRKSWQIGKYCRQQLWGDTNDISDESTSSNPVDLHIPKNELDDLSEASDDEFYPDNLDNVNSTQYSMTSQSSVTSDRLVVRCRRLVLSNESAASQNSDSLSDERNSKPSAVNKVVTAAQIEKCPDEEKDESSYSGIDTLVQKTNIHDPFIKDDKCVTCDETKNADVYLDIETNTCVDESIPECIQQSDGVDTKESNALEPIKNENTAARETISGDVTRVWTSQSSCRTIVDVEKGTVKRDSIIC